MATTTVSIGSNQNIDTETPASTVASSDPDYTITFSSNPNSTVAVGDIIEILANVGSDNTPSSSSGSDPYTVAFSDTVNSAVGIGARFYITDPSTTETYRYDVTNVSGSNYTLDYISGASSAAPPTAIVDEYGDQVDGRFYALNTYLLTEIDGNNYKFKYCTGVSSASPFGLQTNGSQSTATFKRAFSTMILFEAMIDDASPDYWGSSDDVVGELHDDSNFTDYLLDFTNSQSLSSVKITVNSNDRHDGTADSGVVLKPTSGSGGIVFRIAIDDFTVEWLDIDMGSLDSTDSRGCIALNSGAGNATIRNMLMHDINHTANTSGVVGISSGLSLTTSKNWYFLNNIIYSLEKSSSNASTSAISIRKFKGNLYIYNNTIYNITSEGGSKDAVGMRFGDESHIQANIKNNIVAGLNEGDIAAAYFMDENPTSNRVLNSATNLSDDTTDSSYSAEDFDVNKNDATALTGKSLAEIDFVSDSAGSEDLHLDTSSVCLEAGTDLGTTGGVNIDIDGVDRDATGVTWDIGADQKSTVDVEAGAAFFLFIN
jgi:hypothetical protein